MHAHKITKSAAIIKSINPSSVYKTVFRTVKMLNTLARVSDSAISVTFAQSIVIKCSKYPLQANVPHNLGRVLVTCDTRHSR